MSRDCSCNCMDCIEGRQGQSIECPICVVEERDRLRAEVERLRVENERLRAEHDDLAQWLNIFQNIALERRRQDAKWGEQNHDAFLWLAILGEEFGETAKAAIEGRLADMRTELIHVAAVAVAAIESLNRNELVEHRATHDVFKRSAYRVLELRSL